MYKTTSNKVGSTLSIIALIAFLTSIMSIIFVIFADLPSDGAINFNNVFGIYFLIAFFGGFILSIVGFCLSQKGNRTAQLILMIFYILLVILLIAFSVLIVMALAAMANIADTLWETFRQIVC